MEILYSLRLLAATRSFTCLLGFCVLSGCVFYPVVSDNQPDCNLATVRLGIETADLLSGREVCNINDDVESCFIAAAIFLPVTSLAFSGLVIGVNNSVNYIEYHCRCHGDG